MPKWGVSRSTYFYNTDMNAIAKGLASIKYMSDTVADELYVLSTQNTYDYFMDLLYDIKSKTSVDSRQLEILVKIDFFSEFGNQRELLRCIDFFYKFKEGLAKKVRRDEIDGTQIEDIVKRYSTYITKSGEESKFYTLLDVRQVLLEIEDLIKSVGMQDLTDTDKVKNFADAMGYAGYVSGREEDRRKLYVTDTYPLKRKKDGKQFGYSIRTKSIGSGKEARFTVFNKVFDLCPVVKGDIIFCKSFERDGIYFTLTGYERVIS